MGQNAADQKSFTKNCKLNETEERQKHFELRRRKIERKKLETTGAQAGEWIPKACNCTHTGIKSEWETLRDSCVQADNKNHERETNRTLTTEGIWESMMSWARFSHKTKAHDTR
jgi:hypothetical protein